MKWLTTKYISDLSTDLMDLCPLRTRVIAQIIESYFLNHVYTGHYIVICGYDTDADEFEIRDPASSRFFLITFSFVNKNSSHLFTMKLTRNLQKDLSW